MYVEMAQQVFEKKILFWSGNMLYLNCMIFLPTYGGCYMKHVRRVFLLLFTFMFLFASVPVFTEAKESSASVLHTIKQRSEKAKTLNSGKFSVGSSLNDVEGAWGPAEDLSTVAANYWSRNIRFFYDENTSNKVITG